MSKSNNQLDRDVDALFKLPLAEFTDARNSLAKRLKQNGRANDATLVKALAKPSISAWAVNQLFWNHRKEFDQLLVTAQRIRQAQTSRTAAKIADIREALETRRDALSQLSDLATALLRAASHNPAPDTINRITTTLEALSASASIHDGPTPGRLTQDVDPPGFDSLAGFAPMAGAKLTNVVPMRPSLKAVSGVAKTQSKPSPVPHVSEKRRLEEARRIKIAAAKLSLQVAKKSLAEARPEAQRLEAAQKKAQAEAKEAAAKAKQAEKRLREAEEHFEKANTVSEGAVRQAQLIASEAASAIEAVDDAKRNVEKATKELESLFRQS